VVYGYGRYKDVAEKQDSKIKNSIDQRNLKRGRDNRMNEEVIVYRIANSDTIVSVSDNWRSFAHANAWNGPCRPEDVVRRKLWDFIQDRETRQLYSEMFRKVRKGRCCGPIPFRCDSPWERRFLELLMVALPNGHIEITSRILRTEPRDSVGLLDKKTTRSDEFITLCSMCKKMETPDNKWNEIEEVLVKLRLFEEVEMPQVTHGLCPDCYHAAMAELDDSK